MSDKPSNKESEPDESAGLTLMISSLINIPLWAWIVALFNEFVPRGWWTIPSHITMTSCGVASWLFGSFLLFYFTSKPKNKRNKP